MSESIHNLSLIILLFDSAPKLQKDQNKFIQSYT